MILVGNQRGGAKSLALHLLKDENDHVEVFELRGFASDELLPALNEAYAVSRGTRCKQFLFSLSLNPPRTENVETGVFENAIDRIEEKLGLQGQPRAIVFHEKNGRRHAHAVWSRIDTGEMKAVPLPYTKFRLRDISRELYLEHGWTMPHGLMNSEARDPKNFTLAEWQQAKRIGKDPREIKTVFEDCWAVSDTQAAFAHALKERGYVLARGDKRGFVALDFRGEVHSVSKRVGIKAKDVRAKLCDEESLPSVDKARSQIAEGMAARLQELEGQHRKTIDARTAALEQRCRTLTRQHVDKRRAMSEFHEARQLRERCLRQDRFRSGLRGLYDRVTGQHKRIRERNEDEAWQALLRDRREKDALIFRQLEERRNIQDRLEKLRSLKSERTTELKRDIDAYQEMKEGEREKLERHRSDKPRIQRRRPGRDLGR